MPPTPSAFPIQAVLFDYGLVLSGPPDPGVWARMQAILGAPEMAFHDAYWKPRHAYDRGDLRAETYWAQVARLLDKTLSQHQLSALLDADVALWTRPNAPMIDWAARLQRASIRTGILSNLGDAMERGVLERCPWLHNFPHHTFSHRLGMAKPEPAIYALAAQGLGCAPEQVLFVDDKEENIEAARKAGMTALQYPDHTSFLQSLQQAGLTHLWEPTTEVEGTDGHRPGTLE